MWPLLLERHLQDVPALVAVLSLLSCFQWQFAACSQELDLRLSTHLTTLSALRSQVSELCQGMEHAQPGRNASLHCFLSNKTDLLKPHTGADRFLTHADKYWNAFYATNTTHFYKHRNWLTREFPVLNTPGVAVLEVRLQGCFRACSRSHACSHTASLAGGLRGRQCSPAAAGSQSHFEGVRLRLLSQGHPAPQSCTGVQCEPHHSLRGRHRTRRPAAERPAAKVRRGRLHNGLRAVCARPQPHAAGAFGDC